MYDSLLRLILLAGLGLGVAAALAAAAPEPAPPAALAAKASEPAPAARAQEGYLETVRLFHAALHSGDGRGALVRLAENAVIFEAGGAEMSRQEYAEHHLHGDTQFAAATERTITDQRHGRAGDTAWVMTRSETHGTFGDREIHSSGAETMILRHTGQEWRIVHIHWSSRPIRQEEGL